VSALLKEENFSELNDLFYTDLALELVDCGVDWCGYKRMNPYVVRKSTQGLANYVKKFVPDI
jgi:hypothetical protein